MFRDGCKSHVQVTSKSQVLTFKSQITVVIIKQVKSNKYLIICPNFHKRPINRTSTLNICLNLYYYCALYSSDCVPLFFLKLHLNNIMTCFFSIA